MQYAELSSSAPASGTRPNKNLMSESLEKIQKLNRIFLVLEDGIALHVSKTARLKFHCNIV